jgi:diguanylate cyclase (GGDEF)-like protein
VTVGTKLMENWNLPPQLIQAVAHHHAAREVIASAAGGAGSDLTKAVAVAASVGDYFCSTNKGPAWKRLKDLSRAFFGFDEPRLNAFLEQTKTRIEEGRDLFSVDADSLGDPHDLMAQANEHLAQLALREHLASTQAAARQQIAEQQKQELEQKNVELQKQALFDPLTKIYNRNFFDDALNREVNRCRRTASPLAIVFADVDKFKQLNDTYGHPFGDEVLRQVAKALGGVLRRSDVLARYGGEEFIVLVHQPTEKGLEKVAERIRACVEGLELAFEGRPVRVTISVGAAIAVPGVRDESIGKQLVAAADEAMYDSKQRGRNQFHVRSLLDERERRMAALVTAHRFSRWLVARNVLDIPTVSKALLRCALPRIPIGELAVRQGFLEANQVVEVLRAQARTFERFGTQAIGLGMLSQQQVAHLLALQQEDPDVLGMALVSLNLLQRPQVDTLLAQYRVEMPHALVATTGAGANRSSLQPIFD